MIANNVSHSPVTGIQELSFDEIDAVVGARRSFTPGQVGLAIGAVAVAVAFGGVLLGVVGASAVVVGTYEGAAIAIGITVPVYQMH
jgi:hypothetical protein